MNDYINLDSKAPVFIGGCDRSGTTLLGSMLGSHQKVVCVPEAQFIVEIPIETKLDVNKVKPKDILQKIIMHPRFRHWGIGIDLPFTVNEDKEITYPMIIKWVMNHYGCIVGKPNADIWVDHVPTNIRYVDFLLSMFPSAKFLHIIRDGRAVANSLLSVPFGPNTIDRAAQLWLESLAFGFAAEAFLGPSKIFRVKYEDLVMEPEFSLKQICEFLEIDFQSEMIHGRGFQAPKKARKYHTLVGTEPNQDRIMLWKSNLKERQVEIFESLTAGMLVYLGYDLIFDYQTRGLTRFDRLRTLFKTPLMILNNYRIVFEMYKDAGLLWRKLEK
jgi:hypothetical protein